jgi:hypothetical protein
MKKLLDGKEQGPIDLINPAEINAEKIINCYEIDMSECSVRNPKFKENEDSCKEEKYIQPQELIKDLKDQGWIVARVMCYSDSDTNFGHDPAIKHKTVVLMVKLSD